MHGAGSRSGDRGHPLRAVSGRDEASRPARDAGSHTDAARVRIARRRCRRGDRLAIAALIGSGCKGSGLPPRSLVISLCVRLGGCGFGPAPPAWSGMPAIACGRVNPRVIRLCCEESKKVSMLTSGFRRSAVAAAALLVLVVPAGLSAQARPGPDGFADLAEKLLPAVVNISTTQTLKPEHQKERAVPGRPQFPPGSPFEEFFKDFFDHNGKQSDRPEAQPRKATSLGSGFVIDPSGYVVTNNHVIADADEITVILHDDTNLKAELVGRDTKTDVAVLKVKTDKKLPSLVWGD